MYNVTVFEDVSYRSKGSAVIIEVPSYSMLIDNTLTGVTYETREGITFTIHDEGFLDTNKSSIKCKSVTSEELKEFDIRELLDKSDLKIFLSYATNFYLESEQCSKNNRVEGIIQIDDKLDTLEEETLLQAKIIETRSAIDNALDIKSSDLFNVLTAILTELEDKLKVLKDKNV